MNVSMHKYSLPQAIQLQSLAMDIKDVDCGFEMKHGLQVFYVKTKECFEDTIIPEQMLTFTKHNNGFYDMRYRDCRDRDSSDNHKICKSLDECLTQITSLVKVKELEE